MFENDQENTVMKIHKERFMLKEKSTQRLMMEYTKNTQTPLPSIY